MAASDAASLAADLDSRSATSSSVRYCRVPNWEGRCIGVLEEKFHTPCKSGKPHSVLGAL